MSGINALITALLAFLKYPQKLDAHDQARLRFTQLDQDHRFMLHSQHFAYMPIEEVMKQPKRRVDQHAIAATLDSRTGSTRRR